MKIPCTVVNALNGAVYRIDSPKGSNPACVNVSWKQHNSFDPGDVDMYQAAVERHIERGVWKVIDDSLAQRIDYFQVHIDAVRENLESLQKGFEQLKHDVLKGEI